MSISCEASHAPLESTKLQVAPGFGIQVHHLECWHPRELGSMGGS